MHEGSSKILCMTGGLLLLLLAIRSETAWSNEKEIIYKNDLVSVEKTRGLVGMSVRFQREVKKKGREESLVRIQTMPVWSADNGRVEDTLYFPPKGGPKGIDGDPNGDGVAAALWNPPAEGEKYGHSSIAYYALTEKKWVWRDDWPSKFDKARRVKFSSDGSKVIAVGFKNIVMYDARTGKRLETIGEPLKDYPLLSDSVRGSILSPSGRYIVIWQEPAPSGHLLGRWIANKWVTVWDLQTRKEVARWRKPDYENWCAVFTRDEKNILFGSTRGYISTWSIEKQEIIREWPVAANSGSVLDMKFSRDYMYLAVNLTGFHIRLYDYSAQKEIRSFDALGGGTPGDPYPMTFVDGSGFFAFAGGKNRVCVYDTKTWQEKWCYP